MLKVEKALIKNVLTMTQGFNKALETAAIKFAKKEEFDDLKATVKNINKLHEARQYDWIKYAVTTAIGIALTTLLFNKL